MLRHELDLVARGGDKYMSAIGGEVGGANVGTRDIGAQAAILAQSRPGLRSQSPYLFCSHRI